ncbi:helix-turn-helix domain-containing protein [Paraburkholderia silviterrae]|uniref:Helix-turn-helix domain-containing protein n=1 Tax=Paraburkholderia silviterrae TaxID=2528715 RepID=A0A4R5M786_9BURK|nr:helix-turn-helix domain-containing protein [Paraburkholderia silviterrae]TDG21974.1 helix-turn-helix domain-containing protein [Paraburkholderia silviterrae]
MGLLLLEVDLQNKHEISNLFSNAGYQITWGNLSDMHQAPLTESEKTRKSITIFQIQPGLLDQSSLASFSRCELPAWRLSLHQHHLIAPNRKHTKLTTLEFALVKLFALVDKGEVVSRRRIIDEFGEHYLSYDQNRLDTLVTRLRKKTMQHLDTPLPLNTVRVRGFSFDDSLVIDH